MTKRMITCGVCAEPVAVDAEWCPHCGATWYRDEYRRKLNRAILLGFLGLVLLLVTCAKVSAQGFYAKGELHGTLSRCADAQSEWAGCTDAGGEPGVGVAVEAGYAPTSWLDLGVVLGADWLSMTGGTNLSGAHVIPLARLHAPALGRVSPFAEVGYGFGVTATCGTSTIDRTYCSWIAYDQKRNYGGVLLLGGGLRWHMNEHIKPTLSIRRLDYTGDPRNDCCHFDEGLSRRTNTWRLGIGIEWRP